MCTKADEKSAAALELLVEVLRRLAPPRNVVVLSEPSTSVDRDWMASATCAEAGATHLWVGQSGDVSLKLSDGTTLTLEAVAAGVWHPLPYATAIIAQTTTAQGVVIGW